MRYVTTFKVASVPAISMNLTLEQRARSDAPEPEKRALDEMTRIGAKIRREWERRVSPKPPTDPRPAVRALTAAISALYGRLSEWSKLPASDHSEVAQANTMIVELFPKGTTFLFGNHDERWLNSRWLLATVLAPERRSDIERLAGAPFVAAFRKTHSAAGVALGFEGVCTPPPANEDMRELLSAFVESVRSYALQVIAHADLNDPAEVSRVERMLAPIDTHRSRVTVASDETADTPVDTGSSANDNRAPAAPAGVRQVA